MRRGRFLGLLLVLLLLPMAGCAERTTVILVRHAEKVAGSGDVALTEPGRARATRLAELLKHAGITAVFATPYERTRGTAQPTAQALGIEVTVTPISGATSAFAQSFAARVLQDFKGKTVLVVGHSNTTPEVIAALGAPAVPAIPDAEYDNLYIVQVESGGRAQLIRAKY